MSDATSPIRVRPGDLAHARTAVLDAADESRATAVAATFQLVCDALPGAACGPPLSRVGATWGEGLRRWGGSVEAFADALWFTLEAMQDADQRVASVLGRFEPRIGGL